MNKERKQEQNREQQRKQIRLAYIVPDQVWISSVVIGAEVLSAVDMIWQPQYVPKYSKFDISFLHLPAQGPQGFTGLQINTKALDFADYDIIMLPASWRLDVNRLSDSPEFIQWLGDQHVRGATIVGLLSGVFYLAEAGLLDGKEATTHWALNKTFQQRYPKVRLKPKLHLTDAGSLICSSDYHSSMDVVLLLIDRYFGEQAAQLSNRYFGLSAAGREEMDFFDSATQDVLVDAVKEKFRIDFVSQTTLDDIASTFNVSSRTLSRRFINATGMTPMLYLQKHRLQIAKRLLLSTSLPIETISERAGFNSATVFGRAFKQAFGRPPLNYRRYMLKQDL